MSIPVLCASHLAGTPDLPPLVVGPSLGTAVGSLWMAAARRLADTYHVVGWDLPGHGASPRPSGAFCIGDLAEGVVRLMGDVTGTVPFTYAGVSVAGAVGLQLLLDHPHRVRSAALICTGATIGSPGDWRSRARVVRAAGTESLIEQSAQRWFAPGFVENHPAAATAMLDGLVDVDDNGYAHACDALACFDIRDRLAEITTPVLAVAGEKDAVTPPEWLRFIAANVAHGRYVEVSKAAHLAPFEQPGRIADLLVALSADQCAECGFTYDLSEAAAVVGIEERVAEVVAILRDVDVDLQLRRRPEVWSPLEYGCHLRDMLIVQRERVLAARRMDRPDCSPMGRDERVEHDGYAAQAPEDVARQLGDAAELFGNVLGRLDAGDWDRTVVYHYPEPRERSLRWVAVHTMHEVQHHLFDIRSQL